MDLLMMPVMRQHEVRLMMRMSIMMRRMMAVMIMYKG
jgi:hypothetical protein